MEKQEDLTETFPGPEKGQKYTIKANADGTVLTINLETTVQDADGSGIKVVQDIKDIPKKDFEILMQYQ